MKTKANHGRIFPESLADTRRRERGEKVRNQSRVAPNLFPETTGRASPFAVGDSGVRRSMLPPNSSPTRQEKNVSAYEEAQAARAEREYEKINRIAAEHEQAQKTADAEYDATPCDCPGRTNETCQFPDCALCHEEGGGA